MSTNFSSNDLMDRAPAEDRTATASSRRVAVITGGTLGIGLELARLAAAEGYDLVIAADRAGDQAALSELRSKGVHVEFIEADLATIEGVKELKRATDGRRIEVLAANAGHGLGHAFLDQDWADIRHVIDTNITGLALLVHHVGKGMRQRGGGRILLTGSIAGTMPGTYQAVYNATKAFVNSFGEAIREEVKDSNITVTVLMPGATETEFFHRAGLDDTKEGAKSKDSAAAVAKTGWDAMKRGDNHEVHGLPNKIRATLNRWLPDSLVAKQHGSAMKPGGARESSGAPAIGGILAAAAAVGGIALAVKAAQRRQGRYTMTDLRDGRRTSGRATYPSRYAD